MFKKSIENWMKARKLKGYRALLARVAERDIETAAMPDAALRSRFDDFRAQADAGTDVETLLPVVFATVREATRRVLKLWPYESQLLGAFVLSHNAIAEMGTGEGKTLTAAFVAFVQHLWGRKVHICTANDYLAQRDARTLYSLYQFMGLSVGVVRQDQPVAEKKLVYGCDVVYGTHVTFAMDYLSDHLARTANDVVQPRGPFFALVDEADSVLIDDARIPVVLTTTRAVDPAQYALFFELAQSLTRAPDERGEGDFWVDGQNRQAVLTDAGYERVNARLIELGLLPQDETEHYTAEHHHLLYRVTTALAAQHLLFRDQHYVVQDGAIVLVDELTGRLTPGRSWDAGLQQSLETKEGLALSPESMVLGRITLQHYFRLYEGLAGMTGTAVQEAEEFETVYGLDVVEIPPNKPCIRVDEPDRFFRTQAAKMDAVVEDVVARHAKGQPVLIGTASIEQSEELSARLGAMGLKHEVLNARHHEREADIIAQAGVPGAITVSTNMSGRGVDILLGGNPDGELARRWYEMGEDAWNALSGAEQKAIVDEIRATCAAAADKVRDAGGLHIIGMERYESRRMDRQLRGRAGRQGDPGSTCFYLSFEDPLVENFAGERIRSILAQLDVKPGDALESALVRKAVDSAQRQMEGRAADIRKYLVKYDEVLDAQRRVLYAQRDEILRDADMSSWLELLRDKRAAEICERFVPESMVQEGWDLEGLVRALALYGIDIEPDESWREHESDEMVEFVKELLAEQYAQVSSQVPAENLANAQRYSVLAMVDQYWFMQLEALNELRRGINLRAHAKEDPQHAYKKEAFKMFARLLEDIREGLVVQALTWRLSKPVTDTANDASGA